MNTITQTDTDRASIEQLWNSLLPFECPDKFTFNLWLRQHGAETVAYAIEQTAMKRSKLGGEMTTQAAHRLAGAIACSVTHERKHLGIV